MTRRPSLQAVIVAAFAGAMAVVHTGASSSPAQAPTFRSRVDLVTVDVAVQRGGRPVTGLTLDDFEVRDNGVRQTLSRLVTEALPLDAWLVFDASSSLRGEPIRQLQQAASAFVAALAPGDSAALVTFSNEICVPQMPTTNLAAVQSAISRIEPRSATALYDATYVALQLRIPGGSRGVAVVLTDGADTSSWLGPGRVIDAAEHSDVILYGIAVQDTVGGASAGRASFSDLPQYRFLRGLAAASGGRLFDASFATLRETFTKVLNDIRARYLLTYSPDPAPGWHTLDVRLARGRGDVVARRGYWAGAPSPQGEGRDPRSRRDLAMGHDYGRRMSPEPPIHQAGDRCRRATWSFESVR